MKVSVCVLTYNRKTVLRGLLESLSGLSTDGLEIIVVDNHSEDGTESMVKSGFPAVSYLRMDSNLGVAARNAGIRLSTGDVIVTIDDDVYGLTDEKLEILVGYFETHEQVGALNFKVLDSRTGGICNWIHHRNEEVDHASDFLTYEISEGAVALRRKALDRSGLYPEYFFLSHEGADLAFRILDSGYQVRYSGIVEVIHSHASEGRKPWYRYYYDTRNQFLIAMRNFPVLHAIRYLARGMASTMVYSLRDGFLRYWLKGVIDGVRGMFSHSRDRKVLSTEAMRLIQDIDSHRPSVLYMLKKRLFRKEMRL